METRRTRPSMLGRAYYFFNHFPARGWKRKNTDAFDIDSCHLFQSFPRKGMETNEPTPPVVLHDVFFFNHFPARGWKPLAYKRFLLKKIFRLFQSFPRKGMETPALTGGRPSRDFFNHFPARGWKR